MTDEPEGLRIARKWGAARTGESRNGSGLYPVPDPEPPEPPEPPEAPDQPPIPVLLDRLLTRSQLRILPDPEPLIDNVLDQGTTALLYGKWGTAKTFIALDWAACVATGRAWQDRPTEQRRVLYVVGEGAFGFKGRIDAWEVGWQTDVSDTRAAHHGRGEGVPRDRHLGGHSPPAVGRPPQRNRRIFCPAKLAGNKGFRCVCAGHVLQWYAVTPEGSARKPKIG
jgi:hypothetical protein